MYISINMIVDKLEGLDIQVLFEDTDGFFFSGLRLYERGLTDLSNENLYICDSRELTPQAAESGCCFVCIGRGDNFAHDKLPGCRVVLVQDTEISLAAMFNNIQSLFTNLRDWHRNMHVSLIQNDDIQEILEMSESIIGNPIVLVDLSFKLLAYTKNIITDDILYNDLINRGYHSVETVEALTRHKYVSGLKNAKTVGVEFPPEITRYKTATKTFFIKDIPCAYMRMICSHKEPTKSLLELFKILSESVEYYLHNHYFASDIKKYLYEYIIVELIENNISEEKVAEERAKSVGLSYYGEYQLLKIGFDDEENISLSYVLERLGALFPESHPLLYDNFVIMLISFDGRYTPQKWIRSERVERLEEFLLLHRACCSLSEVFTTLLSMKDAYVQTTATMRIGQYLQKKKHKPIERESRIWEYKDYLVYHLIESCAKHVQLRSLCNEQL